MLPVKVSGEGNIQASMTDEQAQTEAAYRWGDNGYAQKMGNLHYVVGVIYGKGYSWIEAFDNAKANGH